MECEYLFLFAQWNVFTAEQCRLVLNKFGSFKEAWNGLKASDLIDLNISPAKASRVIEIRERMSFEHTVNLMEQFNVTVYYIDDSEYPEPLKNIAFPPPFIFVRGTLPFFHKAMAIVGTRAATDYGKLVTAKFTASLVQHGFVIVSGLAMGIDSVAHKAALDNNGITVAVLGSGVDLITPSSNHRLAQQIIMSGGAVLSAYPLGTEAMKHHFPERNVIISGLCQGTLVTEGGMNSGALITARQAHEQGREVFAIPNNINKYALSGTNHLIRNSQAKLVENVEHMLEDMHLETKLVPRQLNFTHEERLILEKLSDGGKSMDELVLETTFDIPRLSELILSLQLKNAIAQQSSRWVII